MSNTLKTGACILVLFPVDFYVLKKSRNINQSHTHQITVTSEQF